MMSGLNIIGRCGCKGFEDGKRLSDYQKIRVKDIRVSGYQKIRVKDIRTAGY